MRCIAAAAVVAAVVAVAHMRFQEGVRRTRLLHAEKVIAAQVDGIGHHIHRVLLPVLHDCNTTPHTRALLFR